MNVFKYPLLLRDDVVEIELPVGAEILYIDSQGDNLCLWARVDPAAPKERRRFRVAGTGHPLAEDVGRHVGSCCMRGGEFVWHVFEVRIS